MNGSLQELPLFVLLLITGSNAMVHNKRSCCWRSILPPQWHITPVEHSNSTYKIQIGAASYMWFIMSGCKAASELGCLLNWKGKRSPPYLPSCGTFHEVCDMTAWPFCRSSTEPLTLLLCLGPFPSIFSLFHSFLGPADLFLPPDMNITCELSNAECAWDSVQTADPEKHVSIHFSKSFRCWWTPVGGDHFKCTSSYTHLNYLLPRHCLYWHCFEIKH